MVYAVRALGLRFSCCVALMAAALVVLPRAALAENGWWEPPGIATTHATQGEVRAAIAKALGTAAPAYVQRVETYAVSAPGVTCSAREFVRGANFRISALLAGRDYGFGRSDGSRWRQTPTGLVHLVLSDVQGDDLDRWPTAYVSDDRSSWVLVGETREAAPAWVLLDRSRYDIPHWFYVDKASGLIVREVTHEGIRSETTTFDDFRAVEGTRRPYAWHVRGAGPTLDVAVTGIGARPVTVNEVAIPGSTSDSLTEPQSPSEIPATFVRGRITVPLSVNGKGMHFMLDTGTPQIVMSGAAARRADLAPLLGHATATQITVAGTTSRDVPVSVLNYWGDGILGYEFFSGRVVHIDYRRARVDVLPREGFSPPPDAREFDVDFNEGMPLVAARVGRVDGDRFVLDTGSWRLVLGRELQVHHSLRDLDLRMTGAARRSEYLEGGINVTPAVAASLAFGAARFSELPAEVEMSGNETEFPIDGIIGTDELQNFEWWFDADGRRAWMRR